MVRLLHRSSDYDRLGAQPLNPLTLGAVSRNVVREWIWASDMADYLRQVNRVVCLKEQRPGVRVPPRTHGEQHLPHLGLRMPMVARVGAGGLGINQCNSPNAAGEPLPSAVRTVSRCPNNGSRKEKAQPAPSVVRWFRCISAVASVHHSSTSL